jgi:hypothetical protein
MLTYSGTRPCNNSRADFDNPQASNLNSQISIPDTNGKTPKAQNPPFRLSPFCFEIWDLGLPSVNLTPALVDPIDMVQPANAAPDLHTATPDRRRSYRQSLVVRGMLYRDDNAVAPQRVRLRNVSMSGVGFESPTPIEKGKNCRLIIELGPTRLNWRVKVVCCGKMGDAGYIVGGQFVTNELDPMTRSDSDPQATEALYLRD